MQVYFSINIQMWMQTAGTKKTYTELSCYVIKLKFQTIHVIILITISSTFLLFLAELLFFTVAGEEKYCKL